MGLTHYVYHGAEHTRFGHAMGVMHLAGIAVGNLIDRNLDLVCSTFGWGPGEAKDERQRLVLLARLAGLLHDVGHAPFSHTGEAKLFPEDANHEKHGAHIIRNSEIGRIIDRQCGSLGVSKDDVASLVEGQSRLPAGFVQEIISSPWDVDKMDYLLRDSHYCGVQYGTFDMHRILTTLTLDEEDESGSLKLAIDEGGFHALEAFVLARYYMFTQVYFHHVRRAFDLVLTDFIVELLGEESESGKYPDIDQIEEYLKWDDNRIFVEANRRANPRERNLSWRIIHRQHPKAVFETGDSPDAPTIRIMERRLLDAVHTKFPDLAFWIDKAVDHPERFRTSEMLIKTPGDPPRWKEFSRESQPLKGLAEISKIRLYADVRGDLDLEEAVREFCRLQVV